MGRDTQDIDAARRQVRDAAPPSATPDGPSTLSANLGAPAGAEAAFADGSAPEAPPGYELIREVHRGGQGVVYEALQRATKRRVALKFLHEGPFADARDRARFEREVEILGQLKHPNIVTIHDSGTHRGHFYYVMDLVEGRRLNEYVRDDRPAMRALLDLIAAVCEAVGHAHERGIIHRDLKPANILIATEPRSHEATEGGRMGGATPRGSVASVRQPKILDFGLAKQAADPLVSRVTGTGQILGTLPYMAPEQTVGDPAVIDARADIYALGVILYQLLTGHYPYPVTGDMMEVLRNIRETPPMPPSQRWTAESGVTPRSRRGRSSVCPIDREVQTIVLKALSKEPERRYQRVGELASDLRRYLAGEPISARGDSFGYRFGKKLRRYRVHLAVAGALIISALLAGYFIVQAKQQDRRATLEKANRLLQDARLEVHRDPDRALGQLEEALRGVPDFVDAKVERAFILKRGKRYPEAISAAEAILEDHPESGEAHLLLAIMLSDLEPERAASHRASARQLVGNDSYLQAMALEPENAKEAVKLLTSALDLDSKNLDARRERAWRRLKLRDFQGMLEDTHVLVEVEPQVSAYWNLRGLALSGLGRLEEALRAYDKSIEYRPNYAPTYLNRANLYLNRGNLIKAELDCDSAIEIEPDFPDSYALRARVRGALKRFDAGLADCERAIALRPTSALAYQSRGHLLKNQQKLRPALDAYQKCVELDGSMTQALYEMADLYRLLAQYDDAVNTCTRIIELSPSMYNAMVLRGTCYMRLGSTMPALADFTYAIASHPKAPRAYHQRARAYWGLGSYAEALADAEVAILLQSDDAEVKLLRGLSLWFLDDLEGAARDLNAAIAKDPEKGTKLNLWIRQKSIDRGAACDLGIEAARIMAQARFDNDSWECRLLSYCADWIGPTELLGAAFKDGERCEANYYIGVKAELMGDQAEAVSSFKMCQASQALQEHEYYMAQWHLRRSGHGPSCEGESSR